MSDQDGGGLDDADEEVDCEFPRFWTSSSGSWSSTVGISCWDAEPAAPLVSVGISGEGSWATLGGGGVDDDGARMYPNL